MWAELQANSSVNSHSTGTYYIIAYLHIGSLGCVSTSSSLTFLRCFTLFLGDSILSLSVRLLVAPQVPNSRRIWAFPLKTTARVGWKWEKVMHTSWLRYTGGCFSLNNAITGCNSDWTGCVGPTEHRRHTSINAAATSHHQHDLCPAAFVILITLLFVEANTFRMPQLHWSVLTPVIWLKGLRRS